MVALKMCPFEHRQFFFEALPASVLVGSHSNASVAISGNLVPKSLKPFSNVLLAQIPQPVDLSEVLLATLANHLCPKEHFQGIFFALLDIVEEGSQPSASSAISGNKVFRSFVPGKTFFPEQKLQPLVSLPVLELNRAFHLCPLEQIQFNIEWLPAVNESGSQPSASFAN
jgi:hypothetical protein